MEYKDFKIVGDKTFGMVEIKPVGKGSVPLTLRGSYTSPRLAMIAIDSELSRREKEANAPTKRRSRIQ